jgi:hypothetical protein
MAAIPFGPGTCKFTIAAAEYPVETEVTGGSVKHSYSEVERKAVLADTVKPSPRLLRDADALSLELLNDLSADGLYALIQAHDLETAQVTFTPNTPGAASWAGTVTLRLPDEIGASEWGEDITSTIELPAAGTFTFTPAGA